MTQSYLKTGFLYLHWTGFYHGFHFHSVKEVADDDEIMELMNDIYSPPAVALAKSTTKSWGELRDGINKILKEQKKKVSLPLSQVSL